jgi:hypothetical protein
MNKQKISRAFLSTLTFLLFTSLTATFGLCQNEQSGRSDTGKANQDQEAITEKNSFSKQGPGGKWSLHTVFDFAQIDDSSVPVAIVKIIKFLGHKQWRNVKFTGLTLDNRSIRSVKAVQIRWIITSERDREAILLQGLTPLFEARIPAHEQRDVEPPIIDFAAVTKPLQKKGTLNGEFTIRLKVSEVHFEDGFVWKEEPQAKANRISPNRTAVKSPRTTSTENS